MANSAVPLVVTTDHKQTYLACHRSIPSTRHARLGSATVLRDGARGDFKDQLAVDPREGSLSGAYLQVNPACLVRDIKWGRSWGLAFGGFYSIWVLVISMFSGTAGTRSYANRPE